MIAPRTILALAAAFFCASSTLAQTQQDSESIADRYLAAMQRKKYSFLSPAELTHRRDQIAIFSAKYLETPLTDSSRQAILEGIDRCIDRLYPTITPSPIGQYINGFGSGGEEWMYLNDRDLYLNFQYYLWIGLTHKPLTPQQIETRAQQYQWLRDHFTQLKIRPGDWLPPAVKKQEDLRPWILDQLEKSFSDPLEPMYEPLDAATFQKLQKRLTSYTNGMFADLYEIRVYSMQSRFPDHPDPRAHFGRTFVGDLPWNDPVVDLWGGPKLHFLSNAEFRGNSCRLSRGYKYDVTRCREIKPATAGGARNDGIAAGATDGDIQYAWGILAGLNGTTMAEIPIKTWFDADRLTDAELRNVLRTSGSASISVKKLPDINGTHRGDRSEGEFFIVVQTRSGRLAILLLHNLAFNDQLWAWCRPRPLTAKNNATDTSALHSSPTQSSVSTSHVQPN